jgi:hypothetical protein
MARVLELREPFRRTVLLRYFKGRSSAEIARAQSVPDGTVRWRLKSAIDQLRARLDQEAGGDRARWHRALLPLLPAGRRGTLAPTPTRALRLALGVAVVMAIATTALLVHRARPTDRRATARSRAAASGAAAPGWGAATPDVPGSAAGTIEVEVVADGRPLPDASWSSSPRARSRRGWQRSVAVTAPENSAPRTSRRAATS